MPGIGANDWEDADLSGSDEWELLAFARLKEPAGLVDLI
jgi:hypothetical protein